MWECPLVEVGRATAQSPDFRSRGLCSLPGQSILDLWRTKWLWEKVLQSTLSMLIVPPIFYCCTVHFDKRRVHSPTNALLLI